MDVNHLAVLSVVVLALLAGCAELGIEPPEQSTPTPAPTPVRAPKAVTPTPTPLPHKIGCVIDNLDQFKWTATEGVLKMPATIRVGPYNFTYDGKTTREMNCYMGKKLKEDIDNHYCSQLTEDKYKLVTPLETDEQGIITSLAHTYRLSNLKIEADKTGHILSHSCTIRRIN
ncbi:MAG: hypothetical protein KAW41_01220 [Candidatus Diapherotrites archaeon]|nr:hypothetical protein [Candidatus Diapherotrites archaeon]